MDLKLFPSCDLVVVLFDLLEQLQAVEIFLLNVLLVDVDEVNLDRQAGPLTVLEDFEHIVDVVHQPSSQNICLIEDLRELDSSFSCQERLLLLLADIDGQALQEESQRLELDGNVEFDPLEALVVLIVEDLMLIWNERGSHAQTHWEERRRLRAALVSLGSISEDGKVELARVYCLRHHVDQLTVLITSVHIGGVYTLA